MVSSEKLLSWLKAVGEPTRLRILRLCSASSLSGSDLARVLHQSEPRVAHHLKVLTDAGLLRRVRQGQWVHYGLSRAKPAIQFAAGLFGQLDPADPLCASDRADAGPATDTAGIHLSESRLGRELFGFVAAEKGAAPLGSALLIGVAHLEKVEGMARTGCACTAVAGSRRAAQAARAFVERRGLHARVVPSFAADHRDHPGSYDAVLVDHLSVPHQALGSLLASARRSLRRDGRIWLFERYDSLESASSSPGAASAGASGRNAEHPLARLRRELNEAGFQCRRLTPIEADGEHVLAASAA